MQIRTSISHRIALCLGFALVGAGPAYAVPRVIDQQGQFLRSDGTPESGSFTVTFAVYSSPSGGGPRWSESRSITLAEGGYYSVLLGETTSFPTDLWDGQPRYLGITISGESEMTPRLPIASVPYALRAAEAVNAIGDITPRSITVNGKLVVDSAGNVNVPGGTGGGLGFATYVQWGVGACTNGAQTLQSGFAFGDHTDEGSGLSDALCIGAGATPGPIATYSTNDLFAVNIRGGATVHPNNIRDDTKVKCALCGLDSRGCFRIDGVDGCPSGFKEQYSGYLYSGNGAGPQGHLCIDGVNYDAGIANFPNTASYIHPTSTHVGFGVEGTGVAPDRYISCRVCCAN
jgi:hypothetical protein